MSVELTEKVLSNAAGWEVMKLARAYCEQGQVVSSAWSPPLLRGVVRVGDIFFRASLIIKNEIDIENLCTCRDAREWGKNLRARGGGRPALFTRQYFWRCNAGTIHHRRTIEG